MVLEGTYEDTSVLQEAKSRGPKDGLPPSPFIPKTQIQYAWDATSLDALKKCPRYYQLRIVENWQSKNDNIHLRFGLEVHSAIEDFEHAKAEGCTHDAAMLHTLRALLARIKDWEPEPTKGRRSEELKSKGNLVRAVVWYLDHYKEDAAKTLILDNGLPAVELSFAFELPWGPRAGYKQWEDDGTPVPASQQPYLLCGHLDKVVSFSGDLYVMDHKTATNVPNTNYFNQWDPNNQMTVYTIAAQTIMKSPIRGVIVDAIQLATTFTRPTRGFTMRGPQRLDEWLHDLKIWLEQAEGYAEAGYWPQNDTACSMYGGCAFREACSKSPGVRTAYLRSKFTQEGERWNPLKPR